MNPADIPGSGGTSGSGGAGGSSASSSACLNGMLRCPCYPNNTCNDNLACVSQVCVELPGSGGVTGSGGVVVSGGTITGSGGVLISGSTTTSSGGMGGSSSSSACQSGMVRCDCYANMTCNAGLVCVSQVCVELPGTGGVTGSGGVVVSGGTIASSGGVVVSGGTSGSGGTGASSQVCSDATHCYLGVDGSSVPASGNSYGIDGGFYVVGDTCTQATITWNAATRCASGVLCAKDPPYYSNWGAEIGLALKSSGGYDYGYDATANGVTGFFWEVTGSAPGMQVWIPITASVSACLQTSNACTLQEPPWGNPTPSLGPAGNNYVMIQSGYMSYDDWGLYYTYPPPWDPTRLHSIQWKLPARDLSTPFNFCVQKVGIIHN